MKSLPFIILALATGVLTCPASEEKSELRVTSKNGMSSLAAQRGEMTWAGELSLEHASFRMSVIGRATVFNGPALQQQPPQAPGSTGRKITAYQQCISIVALGDVTVVLMENGKESKPYRGSRVVYIPNGKRLLVDGKEITRPG